MQVKHRRAEIHICEDFLNRASWGRRLSIGCQPAGLASNIDRRSNRGSISLIRVDSLGLVPTPLPVNINTNISSMIKHAALIETHRVQTIGDGSHIGKLVCCQRDSRNIDQLVTADDRYRWSQSPFTNQAGFANIGNVGSSGTVGPQHNVPGNYR